MKEALSYLRSLAAKHRAEGHTSKEIYIGNDLYDSAVAEALHVVVGSPDRLFDGITVDGIKFIPIRKTDEENLPDVPLSERGFV